MAQIINHNRSNFVLNKLVLTDVCSKHFMYTSMYRHTHKKRKHLHSLNGLSGTIDSKREWRIHNDSTNIWVFNPVYKYRFIDFQNYWLKADSIWLKQIPGEYILMRVMVPFVDTFLCALGVCVYLLCHRLLFNIQNSYRIFLNYECQIVLPL